MFVCLPMRKWYPFPILRNGNLDRVFCSWESKSRLRSPFLRTRTHFRSSERGTRMRFRSQERGTRMRFRSQERETHLPFHVSRSKTGRRHLYYIPFCKKWKLESRSSFLGTGTLHPSWYSASNYSLPIWKISLLYRGSPSPSICGVVCI